MPHQQARFDRWRAEFNEDRPHDALGEAVPASRYTASPRPMPTTLPEPEYPGHFETRWVSSCGTYKWQGRQLFLSQALHHEWVGFERPATASGRSTSTTGCWPGSTSATSG